MTACVLDSSAALAWVLPDEEGADALLDSVIAFGAMVPPLWPFEVANVLLQVERRGRLAAAAREQALRDLQALPIRIDGRSCDRVWTETHALAAAHRLTVYDASYLEMAQRLGLPLATLDADLRSAATACGVPLAL